MPQPRKLHDEFFKRSKAEGYVARSAYKLLEINEKKNLILIGHRVIDLGSAPGSWLQVSEKLTGRRGRVLGIDLQELNHPFGPNVLHFVADVFTTPPEVLLEPFGGRKANVLLSDMAPNTTGHGDDHLSARLCRRVLELAPSILKPGGNLLMKVLEGGDMPALMEETRALFREVGATKPAASRDVSREIFIWAKGFQGTLENDEVPQSPANKHKIAPKAPAGWGSVVADSRSPESKADPKKGESGGASLPG